MLSWPRIYILVMQFFVDTASLAQIQELSHLGLIDGVTTNPSLIAKEGIKDEEALYARYAEICEAAPDNVSLEVVSTEPEAMLKEAQRLAAISPKAVIKIAMSPEGLSIIRQLKKAGIRSNCTLIFSPLQALLAAKAGASYVSPFVGRLDDIHSNGMSCVADIKQIFQHYGFSTQILAASIRHVQHLLQAARIGVEVATCPYNVLLSMLSHPLTEKGAALFLSDYQKAMGYAALHTKD